MLPGADQNEKKEQCMPCYGSLQAYWQSTMKKMEQACKSMNISFQNIPNKEMEKELQGK